MSAIPSSAKSSPDMSTVPRRPCAAASGGGRRGPAAARRAAGRAGGAARAPIAARRAAAPSCGGRLATFSARARGSPTSAASQQDGSDEQRRQGASDPSSEDTLFTQPPQHLRALAATSPRERRAASRVSVRTPSVPTFARPAHHSPHLRPRADSGPDQTAWFRPFSARSPLVGDSSPRCVKTGLKSA